MGDGSTKPLSDVEVGDEVLATDPETGERGARLVTGVWVHDDTVIDLEVDGQIVTTTEDHPFWNVTDGEWEPARFLDSGDKLLGADGALLEVTGIVAGSERSAIAYNLTVEDLHTYYVLAGGTPVLVHNDPRPSPADYIDGPLPQRGQTALYALWDRRTHEFIKWGIWTNTTGDYYRYAASVMDIRNEQMTIIRNYDIKKDALAAERFVTSLSPGPGNAKELLAGKGTGASWQQALDGLKGSGCW